MFRYPEVLILFVVGLPLKDQSVEELNNDTQLRLNLEFEMFGDILQVHFGGTN